MIELYLEDWIEPCQLFLANKQCKSGTITYNIKSVALSPNPNSNNNPYGATVNLGHYDVAGGTIPFCNLSSYCLSVSEVNALATTFYNYFYAAGFRPHTAGQDWADINLWANASGSCFEYNSIQHCCPIGNQNAPYKVTSFYGYQSRFICR